MSPPTAQLQASPLFRVLPRKEGANLKIKWHWLPSLLLLLLFPHFALAAAWTIPQGSLQYYKNSYYYSTADYFDVNGNRQAQERYTKFEITPYLEYGWREGTTLGASWGLDVVRGTTQISPTLWVRGTNYGVSDPSFFLRQRLWEQGPLVVSVQPLLKLPSVFRYGFLPHSGSEHWDSEMRLLGGYGFDWQGRHHFLNLETAYRKRFGDSADQWRSNVTVGFSLSERWMIIPELSVIRNLGDTGTIFTQGGEDDYDLLKPQLSAVYALTPTMSLQAGVFDHLEGENTGAGAGFLFSVWYRP